jgi:hypothetical protein
MVKVEDPRSKFVNLQVILTELKRERDRLTRAIAALEELDSSVAPSKRVTVASKATSNGKGQGRNLTAAGRKRLSEMMKKRWAERRKKTS